jgi:hypothetical protein
LEQLIDRIILTKDEQAMLDFLSLFEKDMDVLSRYMRMPKEDAIQWLKLGMMEIVLQHKTKTENNGCLIESQRR